MTRIEGWEARLAAEVEAARAKPYEIGVHDCFRFACACVQALTGVDLWAQYGGGYRTRREAMRELAKHGASFDEVFSTGFGVNPISPRLARRGDVLKYEDARGAHLGVCVGGEAALLDEEGLVFLPLARCAHAWRIG